ncbi:MAG TPA: PhnD/SsuA/transferrin family substrate-binding protein [Anaerolineales bacterium]|nr:PhnD/SsuA/transferrin family substrate-binding protein [Anaerolineales bacterium]
MQIPRLAGLYQRRAQWKALLFLLFFPIIFGCGLSLQGPTETPAPVLGPSPTPLPTVPPPVSILGTAENPLILALPPATKSSTAVENAAKTLIGLLEKGSGYHIVSVLPPNEKELVKGFGIGNAHIGVLTPFAYLQASNDGNVQAAFAREVNKEIFYGAQYLANVNNGFTPYFDTIKQADIAEAPIALGQFQDKKPCWTDELSPSGYVVPLGYLNQAQVVTHEPAFLAGHVAVVRALAAGGICDFGATYIDARTYPGLQDEYPNLMKQVIVIWQIPPIIPYETLVYASGMPEEMRRNLTRAFVDLSGTPDGKAAMSTLYGFESMQVAQDSQYDLFRKAVKASGVDLIKLIK